jgi:hypothetical protein
MAHDGKVIKIGSPAQASVQSYSMDKATDTQEMVYTGSRSKGERTHQEAGGPLVEDIPKAHNSAVIFARVKKQLF